MLVFAVGDECDPSVYKVLNEPSRSQDDTFQSDDLSLIFCDQKVLTPGWYRFEGAGGTAMSTTCVPTKRCRTHASGYLVGAHPTIADGTVTRQVCYHWGDNCCTWSNNIRIRNCGSFYVYELQKSPQCYLRYCTNPHGKFAFIKIKVLIIPWVVVSLLHTAKDKSTPGTSYQPRQLLMHSIEYQSGVK